MAYPPLGFAPEPDEVRCRHGRAIHGRALPRRSVPASELVKHRPAGRCIWDLHGNGESCLSGNGGSSAKTKEQRLEGQPPGRGRRGGGQVRFLDFGTTSPTTWHASMARSAANVNRESFPMQDEPEGALCFQHKMSLNGREGMLGIANQHGGRREAKPGADAGISEGERGSPIRGQRPSSRL